MVDQTKRPGGTGLEGRHGPASGAPGGGVVTAVVTEVLPTLPLPAGELPLGDVSRGDLPLGDLLPVPLGLPLGPGLPVV